MNIKNKKLITYILTVLFIVTPTSSQAYGSLLWNFFLNQKKNTAIIAAFAATALACIYAKKLYTWYMIKTSDKKQTDQQNTNSTKNSKTQLKEQNQQSNTLKKQTETPGKDPVKQTGFNNSGNNCYINATLQALFHTPQFVSHVLNQLTKLIKKQSHQKSDISLNDNITKLYEVINKNQTSKNQSIDISECHQKIKKLLGLDKLNNQQQDSAEALRAIIASIEKLFKDNKTVFKNLFISTLNQHFKSTQSNTTKTKTEFDIALALPISTTEQTTLQQLINTYTKEKSIQDHQKYDRQTTSLVSCPEILIIQLKRGQYNIINDVLEKNSTPVTFDQTLTINNVHYTCNALVVHHGPTISSGHYTCYTPQHHYNDSRVETSNGFATYATKGIIDDSLNTGYEKSTPYILIFTKDRSTEKITR